MPISVNAEQLNQLISQEGIVVVDFWASWCAPCLAFSDIYEKVANENIDISFTKVNIEEHADLAAIFEIQSIPHLLIFKNSLLIYSDSGSMPASTLKDLCHQARLADLSTIADKTDEQ